MPNAAVASSSRGSLIVIVAAGVSTMLVAAAGALWAYYGTAVFYEMIVTGLAYCF